MKVSVTVTLDVDPEAWAAEYGVDRSEVRGDVKVLASSALQQHFETVGVLSRRADDSAAARVTDFFSGGAA